MDTGEPAGGGACLLPQQTRLPTLPALQQVSVLGVEAAPLPSGLNALPLCPGERRLLAGPWQPPHSPRHVWPQALGLRPNTLGGEVVVAAQVSLCLLGK